MPGTSADMLVGAADGELHILARGLERELAEEESIGEAGQVVLVGADDRRSGRRSALDIGVGLVAQLSAVSLAR